VIALSRVVVIGKLLAVCGLGVSLIPGTARAASGSWQASQRGVSVEQRQQLVASAPLVAPSLSASLPLEHAVITGLSWRYQLFSPAPAQLQVQLCSSQKRCLSLAGALGTTHLFDGQSAQSSFYFAYQVPGKGVIFPTLRVVSEQLIVNYRQQ
jgi:flagellar protein FlhE